MSCEEPAQIKRLRADKVWLELSRQGTRVARRTPERPMRQLGRQGVQGVRCGGKACTTRPGQG